MKVISKEDAERLFMLNDFALLIMEDFCKRCDGDRNNECNDCTTCPMDKLIGLIKELKKKKEDDK